ncbi:MAG: KTSC domain-containing protein [Acidobacteriota bacterium]|nr:KTSC domain-containing protein [Acidobacteriota bacterium]
MKWVALESKMLSAAAYDDAKQILYLRFRNTGDVYRYFDFPAADYQAFLSAESRGRCFRFNIRDHFRCERMARLHAA